MNNKLRLANYLATKKKDYQEGLEIFIALQVDPSKNVFLSSGKPDKMKQGILQNKLIKFARIHGIKPTNKVLNVNVPSRKLQPIAPQVKANNQGGFKLSHGKVKIDSNPVVRFEDLNEEMQERYKENGILSGEIKTFHAELKAAKGDNAKKERRAEIAQLLVNKKTIYRENWKAIDEWWRLKQTKTPEEIAVEEAIAKEKRIKSNKIYIQRNFFNTREKQQKELKKRMEELDRWGISYEEIIEKLKADAKQ